MMVMANLIVVVIIPCGVVGNITRFHCVALGSIPGMGSFFFWSLT